MPAIKHQIPNSCPEISLGEIHIPDDRDLGTGTFTTTFSPSALPPVNAISSMIKGPSFLITATVNPNLEIPVLLGVSDGTPPKHAVTFVLPDVLLPVESHVLVVRFARWRVMTATLDGVRLETPGETAH
jgi:hypothetical protein